MMANYEENSDGDYTIKAKVHIRVETIEICIWKVFYLT